MILIRVLSVFSFLFSFSARFAHAADMTQKYIPDQGAGEQGMTLWQVIVSGGEVMILLSLLSMAALGLIVYYFLTIKQESLVPEDLREEVVSLIERERYDEASSLCGNDDNLISGIVRTALSKRGREKIVIKESIQDEGRRGLDGLRQKLSYLADIAAISPMVGLLGTVLGMIQAFNVIAFQTGAVKPILLASGISKAMVTTAAGLIVAIPAMIFYSIFRGRIQSLTVHLENFSQELYHLLTDGRETDRNGGA